MPLLQKAAVRTLGVAISNWDGNRRTHLYNVDDAAKNLYGQRTLCGHSTLGWEKIVPATEDPVDCKRCQRSR